MIDLQSVQKWLDDYVAAWKSYDAAAIGALFSEDANYRYNPFDEPVKGREAIVAGWLENRDTPDDSLWRIQTADGQRQYRRQQRTHLLLSG